MSIKMRILIPMIVFTIVASTVILISDIFQFSHYVESDISNRLNMAALTALSEIDGMKAQSYSVSKYMSKDKIIIQALELGDVELLTMRAAQMYAETGVGLCAVSDSTGLVLTAAHNPSSAGRDSSGLPYVDMVLSGKTVTTIQPGVQSGLAVYSMAPIINNSGTLLGVASAGFSLATDDFVNSIKEITDCEVTVCSGDLRISTTITQEDGENAIGTRAPSEISEIVLDGNIYSGRIRIMNNDMIARYHPIFGADGKTVGMLFVGHFTDEATRTIGSFLKMGLLFMVGFTIIFVIIILYITGHIVMPINEATDVLRKISKGNFDARVVGDYRGDLKIIKDSVNTTALELSLYLNEKVRAERIAHESEMAKARAVEATNVKTEFLASMSHEIRTPMNSIIGMSELLSAEQLNEQQREYVRSIKISSVSLLGIINDILDMTKIEAGKLTLTPVDFLLKPFLANIVSVMSFSAETKGIDLIFEEDKTLPECLFGDDVRVRQILLNLLSNAIKFTDIGSVTFSARYEDGSLNLTVRDTGIGIRKADIERLFDTFERVDEVKNRHRQGTGLGLTITKSLIDMMNGRIDVKSVYGEGTAFMVSIPLPPGDAGKAENAADAVVDALSAEDAAVLLVDDNEANLNVGQGLLRLNKIECDTASDGAEAIAMIMDKDYDIVFMDHMMPGMDGVEATERIRAMGGKYEKLPIIALTANAVTNAREMFLSSGMNDFLAKPIERSLLVKMLRKWLPAEKVSFIKKETGKNIACEEDETIAGLRQIEGLDVDAGLSLTGGSAQLYKSTVEIITKRLAETVQAMTNFLKAGDLENFMISVHGVKSSLATAGAKELSRQALEFETAASNGNLSFCKRGFPKFSERLISLYKQLSEVFFTDSQEPLSEGDTQVLSAQLDEVKRCLDEFDDEAALELLAEMRKFSYSEQINELLSLLNNQIEIFDYEKAAETADSIKGHALKSLCQ